MVGTLLAGLAGVRADAWAIHIDRMKTASIKKCADAVLDRILKGPEGRRERQSPC